MYDVVRLSAAKSAQNSASPYLSRTASVCRQGSLIIVQLPLIHLTSDHHVLGLDFFKLLTFVANNFAHNSSLSLFSLFPDEKTRWRNIINRLKSLVTHGASSV